MIRKLVVISTAVLTTLLALVVVWQLHIVAIYVLISLLLAATVRPLIKRLDGRKFISRMGWILLYLAIISGIAVLIFFTGKAASFEIQNLARSVSVQDTWVLPSWIEGSTFHQLVTGWLPPPSKLFESITGDKGQLVLPALLSFLQNAGSVVTGFIIILFLSIYWSINQIHFERLWLSLLPPGQRKQARGVWRVIEPEIGAYIRGLILQSLGSGILIGLGLWIIGSPYPALLGIVAALASMIPMIGVVLLVIFIFLIGLLTSVPLGLFSALLTVIVFACLAIWLKPQLFKGKWENPIITIVLIMVMADALGIIGIIVAPVISVICQILWHRLVSHRRIAGASELISDLLERQKRLKEKINGMTGEQPPLITSSMERLDDLLAKAQPVLKLTESQETVIPPLRTKKE